MEKTAGNTSCQVVSHKGEFELKYQLYSVAFWDAILNVVNPISSTIVLFFIPQENFDDQQCICQRL